MDNRVFDTFANTTNVQLERAAVAILTAPIV